MGSTDEILGLCERRAQQEEQRQRRWVERVDAQQQRAAERVRRSEVRAKIRSGAPLTPEERGWVDAVLAATCPEVEA